MRKDRENNFILKELALLYKNGDHVCFIVRPPFPYDQLNTTEQTQAEWLRNNHHGLAWDSGSFSYTSVMQFVQQNTRDIVILVKGIEKTIWTEEFMLEGVYRPLNVIHVEEHGIPNLKRLQCFYPHIRTCDHCHSGVCALQNTLLIRNHLLKMCAPDMI